VRRTSMQLAAAIVAGGLAVAGCGSSLQLGAAATTGTGRITSAALTNQVANLTAAYQADKAKGVTPQDTTEIPQRVLTWLIKFQVWNRVARQHGIHVTQADIQAQVQMLAAAARQNKVSTAAYVSAAGALPPDLLPEIGRYGAILQALQDKFDGGRAPASQAAQTALNQRGMHAQCLAAKSLGIRVNPQYGELDYASFSVVPVPATLSGVSGPKAKPSSKPTLTPPC
jgi:SurA N-terminal domain